MMRQTVLVLLVSLLSMYAIWDSLRGKPCCHGQVEHAGDQHCWASDVDEHMEPTTTEDQALLDHLVQQGTRLLKEGKSANTADLIRQLGISRCELQVPQPAALADNSVDVYARGKDGVVVVGSLYACKKCNKFHARVASGFVLTATGAVVTGYHVVDHRETEALVVMTGRREVLPVRQVLAASRTDDLAILQVNAEGLTPLPVAATLDAAAVGSPVGVISHPAGRFYCYTSGVVCRYTTIRSAGQRADAVWITADFARGSSGAPVLNREGQVVAIVRSTEPIYHSDSSGQAKNLQMVFKTCTPTANLFELVGSQTWTVRPNDETM